MPAGAQAETCRGCHQPERIQGDRFRVIREYADDEANTESKTILQLHVASGSSSGRAIHWHADPAIRIEYVATDEARQTIPYVKVIGPDRTVREYVSAEANEQTIASGQRRMMDCLDCHNTIGHPIAQTPERGVDAAIASGQVSRQLPYARREAVRLMTTHAAAGDGGAAIDRDLRTFYQSARGSTDQQALARAASALQDVYRRNVFPAMKVTWGSYPDNKGHITSHGCFRCHDGSHAASDGSTINADCEYCHKQIE
jgi:hypothetical protein